MQQKYGRCRAEKYGLSIGYYFFLNSSAFDGILFKYYTAIGQAKVIYFDSPN